MYDLDFNTPGNDGSAKLTGAQLTDLYKEFLAKYPVVSIEDPFDQVSAVWCVCCFVGVVAVVVVETLVVGYKPSIYERTWECERLGWCGCVCGLVRLWLCVLFSFCVGCGCVSGLIRVVVVQ